MFCYELNLVYLFCGVRDQYGEKSGAESVDAAVEEGGGGYSDPIDPEPKPIIETDTVPIPLTAPIQEVGGKTSTRVEIIRKEDGVKVDSDTVDIPNNPK